MRSKTKSVIVGLLLLGLLTWVSGCGDGDSTSASLTKAQYLKQAKAICEKGEREQLEMAGNYLKKHPGAEEEDMIVPAALPPLEKQIEKLKELSAPEGDEAKVEAFVAAFEEGLEKGRAKPQDLMSASSNPFDKANNLGKKYGFVNCAAAP